MATLNIAAESSVQGIDTKIGATNDSISTATIMGKLNKLISYMDTTETVTENTETIVSSAISGTWQAAGTFTATKTGIYNVTCSMKASTTTDYVAAWVASSELTSANKERGQSVCQTKKTTYTEYSSKAYLTAGVTYYFYIGSLGNNTAYINSLTVSWTEQKDDLEAVRIVQATTAEKRTMNLITSSGNSATPVKVASWKVLFDGKINVRVTRDEGTIIVLQINGDSGNQPASSDTTEYIWKNRSVNAGYIINVYAYGPTAYTTWKINSVAMYFSLAKVIDDPNIVIV